FPDSSQRWLPVQRACRVAWISPCAQLPRLSFVRPCPGGLSHPAQAAGGCHVQRVHPRCRPLHSFWAAVTRPPPESTHGREDNPPLHSLPPLRRPSRRRNLHKPSQQTRSAARGSPSSAARRLARKDRKHRPQSCASGIERRQAHLTQH